MHFPIRLFLIRANEMQRTIFFRANQTTITSQYLWIARVMRLKLRKKILRVLSWLKYARKIVTCPRKEVRNNKIQKSILLVLHWNLWLLFFIPGTITYSFALTNGENPKFEINNATGLIRTTRVLDRDEPAREKEAYLTVLGTDNGKSQLDDVCTFKVTIKDINDNAPVFDKVVSASTRSWIGHWISLELSYLVIIFKIFHHFYYNHFTSVRNDENKNLPA